MYVGLCYPWCVVYMTYNTESGLARPTFTDVCTLHVRRCHYTARSHTNRRYINQSISLGGVWCNQGDINAMNSQGVLRQILLSMKKQVLNRLRLVVSFVCTTTGTSK